MSTDTENGSLATAEAQRIAEKLAQIKTWAVEREIPFDAVAAAFGQHELASGIEQPLPPNHTCVTWFDIHRPDGGKLHVVVRGGATRDSVLDVVFTASNAFGDLVKQGWMPADRRPRTEAEIAETKVKLEERFAASKASKATKEPAGKAAGAKRAKKAGVTPDSGDVEGSTRTMEVDSICKMATDKGNLYYQVKGFPWRDWGVKAWPDTGQVGKLALLVDMDAWKVGELIEFKGDDIQAVARLKLKEGSEPPKLIPDKVIDFVGDDALPDVPEDYDDGLGGSS